MIAYEEVCLANRPDVIIVVGDAPPHDMDVARMLRDIQRAKGDELYDLPLILHTVSTHTQGVEHFGRIAQVGGGAHITLRQTSRLVDELILLSFGGFILAIPRPRIAALMGSPAPPNG